MALDAIAVALPLINVLRRALERTKVVTSHPARFSEFMTCFGWDVTLSDAETAQVRDAMGIEAPLATLNAAAQALEGGANETETLAQLITGIVATTAQIANWSSGNFAGLPAPFNSAAFWTDFPENLIGQLTTQGLRDQVPGLHATLVLFNVLETAAINPGGPGRVPFVRQRVHWDRLGAMVTDPVGALKQSLKWGLPGQDLQHQKLLAGLGFLAASTGLPVRLNTPSPAFLDLYYAAGNISRNRVRELNLPFILQLGGGFGNHAELGFKVMPIPDGNPNGRPAGIVIAPLAAGAVQGVPAGSTNWSLALTADAIVDGAFRLEILPSGADLVLAGGDAALDVGLSLRGNFPEPAILIGAERSHRVELEGVFIAAELKGRADSPEVVIRAGTGDGPTPPRLRFIFQASEGDGFLQGIIGSEPQSIDLGGHLTFSNKNGLGINGSAGLQMQFPLHLALGPIEFQSLNLGATGGSAGLSISLGLDIKAALGPLQAVVSDIGAKFSLKPPPAGQSGLLGDLDIDWDFQPPKGVGLSLDVGIVKGGGYLYLDFEREEYAGALELVFSDFLTLKAIGLITTRMPDGSKGFSLLVVITAEFGAGLQLGFGVLLLGVGGLVGLNRTMRLDALMEGVRTGAVESVMFPTDIIANAPRIISDLRAFFPPEEQIFLIGPMAKAGWGTPALITLSLGIIIEIPGNIAIVGVLKVALPTEDAPLIVLQVNFAGAIDFDKKQGFFFAALFESRVIFITIEGEMGLLIAWGSDTNFVLSVGGFHPLFTPPPLPFPSPKRVSLNILNESWGRIRVSGYFAVTSNTVQLGVRAELFFGFSEFKIVGWLSFDALFQFNPFYFIIQISCGVELKVFGLGLFSISLKFSLEGTSPWRAKGYGKLKFLFFSIKARFDFTWGEEKTTTLPPIEVMPLLVSEYEKLENWSVTIPAANSLLVSLRQLPAQPDTLVLHPLGTLSVTQRAVPLGITLDKIGSQKPSDAKKFSIDVTAGLTRLGDNEEDFAIGQFQDLGDGEKLTRPAFEKEEAGLKLAVGNEGMATGGAVKRNLRYETSIIDTRFRFMVVKFFGVAGALFNHFLQGSAVALSAKSQKLRKQARPFDDKITVQAEGYAVAFAADNIAFGADMTFASATRAHEALAAAVKADPGLRDGLHVVPSFELAEAA